MHRDVLLREHLQGGGRRGAKAVEAARVLRDALEARRDLPRGRL